MTSCAVAASACSSRSSKAAHLLLLGELGTSPPMPAMQGWPAELSIAGAAGEVGAACAAGVRRSGEAAVTGTTDSALLGMFGALKADTFVKQGKVLILQNKTAPSYLVNNNSDHANDGRLAPPFTLRTARADRRRRGYGSGNAAPAWAVRVWHEAPGDARVRAQLCTPPPRVRVALRVGSGLISEPTS